MEKIKALFNRLIEEGTIKGKIVGPTGNVLECETMNDYCVASGLVVQAGFFAASPGAFGGDSISRQNSHKRVWITGSLCAVEYNRRVTLFYGLLSEDEQYQLIVDKRKLKN
jgi:hypothetical protein